MEDILPKRLRVLAWPLFTYGKKVSADSGYICFRNLIRAIPEWDWTLLVPSYVDPAEWADDLDDLPNVHKVPVEMNRAPRLQEISPHIDTLMRFCPQEGVEPTDVVVCGSNQIALAVTSLFQIRIQQKKRPTVVAFDLQTRDDKQVGFQTNPAELVMHFAGTAVVDLNVYGSPMMQFMTERMLKRYNSPAIVRDIQQKSKTVYAGVPVARIDEVTAGIPKRDTFTVFYGGRMGKSKNVPDVVEMAQSAFAFGRKMGMVICTGSWRSTARDKFEKEYPWVEMHVGTSQEEAWRLMAGCHAAFSWSATEMIGSMFLEVAAAGIPLIARPREWLVPLIPDEYPFWANDNREGGALLRALYDRWKKDPSTYAERMDPWTRYVREQHDSEPASRAIRDEIRATLVEMRTPQWEAWGRGVERTLIGLAEQVLHDGMTHVEYLRGLERIAAMPKFVGKRLTNGKSHSTQEAYLGARFLGWEPDGWPLTWRAPGTMKEEA